MDGRPPSTGQRQALATEKATFRRNRQGCLNCKFRKVKCDETKPVCGSCLRMHLGCGGWDTTLSKGEYASQRKAFLALMRAGQAQREARPAPARRKRQAQAQAQAQAAQASPQGHVQPPAQFQNQSQGQVMVQANAEVSAQSTAHMQALSVRVQQQALQQFHQQQLQQIQQQQAGQVAQGGLFPTAQQLFTDPSLPLIPPQAASLSTNLFEMDHEGVARFQSQMNQQQSVANAVVTQAQAEAQAHVVQAQANFAFAEATALSSAATDLPRTDADLQAAAQAPYVPRLLSMDPVLSETAEVARVGRAGDMLPHWPDIDPLAPATQQALQRSTVRRPAKAQLRQRTQRGMKVSMDAAAVAASLKAQEDLLRQRPLMTEPTQAQTRQPTEL